MWRLSGIILWVLLLQCVQDILTHFIIFYPFQRLWCLFGILQEVILFTSIDYRFPSITVVSASTAFYNTLRRDLAS